jgi:hypothetical protein
MISSLIKAANNKGYYYPISLRNMAANILPDASIISLSEILKNSGIMLEIPFRFNVHNLPFANFGDGIPSWGTFEDTFGAAEVWHELLDPIFGHPILTGLFFGLYEAYLKGIDNGGYATGFCTSMSSLVADRLWQGRTDTHTITKESVHRYLTAVHGKLLSRESLIHFHDQGLEGISRVEKSAREVEATFLRGCDRNSAPLIFFIPAGDLWDNGYFEKLGKSHCVMPYKLVYPDGHAGPKLAPGGATTLSDLNGVEMYVWDCNLPESANCRLVFKDNEGSIGFEYFRNKFAETELSSRNEITLGMMTNGDYLLADHDLPFMGPLGLTRFVVDFLLSSAELQVTDPNGLRTGNFSGKVLAEIQDSHPFYLVPGAYMLPAYTPLTRRIVGTKEGKYAFNSITPDGGSLALEEVPTAVGQGDELSMNADETQLSFSPAVEKTFSLTLARWINNQVRAIAISGIGGGPAAHLDIEVSPELAQIRIGNRISTRTVEVHSFFLDRANNTSLNRGFNGISLPNGHNLIVEVQDWEKLDTKVQTRRFE